MMEQQDPFTLTFSNESTFFTSNSRYSFRNNVNPPIELPVKKWEVALSKIVIPQTRQVYLPDSEFEIIITLKHTIHTSRRYDPILVTVTTKMEMFSTYDSLVQRFQEILESRLIQVYMDRPELFDVSRDRLPGVRFSLTFQNSRVRFSSVVLLGVHRSITQRSYLNVTRGLDLWRLLGYHSLVENAYFRLPIDADTIATLNAEASTLLVCAPNLVVEHYFGDQTKPILELIPYNINSEVEHSVFEQTYPLYKTIFGGYINNVHIELTDLNDKPIYFEAGKLQVVLHFRPCQTMIER